MFQAGRLVRPARTVLQKCFKLKNLLKHKRMLMKWLETVQIHGESKSEFILFLSLTPRLSPEFLGLAPERSLIESELKAKHVALAFFSSLCRRCAGGRSLEHLYKLLSALSCSAA
jgi:hypothetical protein